MSADETLGKWIDGGDVYKVQGSFGTDRALRQVGPWPWSIDRMHSQHQHLEFEFW
jgi:hypothetical protein